MIAPFLRSRWGRTDSDICWWCEKRRQSREHLFKECMAWKKELWRAAGEASGGREVTENPFKSRKGFGFWVRQARDKPSNTSIRDLLSDDRYTEAVLAFLETTGAGKAKEGIICT